MNVHSHVEVKREHKKSEVEDWVEDPRADPIAPALEEEVEEEDGDVAGDIACQERDLAAEDEGEAGATEADGGPEAVAVDDGVDERGEEDR